MDHLQEGKFTLKGIQRYSKVFTVLKVCVPKVQSGEHVNFPNEFSVFMPGTFTIMLSPTNTNLNYRLVTN